MRKLAELCAAAQSYIHTAWEAVRVQCFQPRQDDNLGVYLHLAGPWQTQQEAHLDPLCSPQSLADDSEELLFPQCLSAGLWRLQAHHLAGHSAMHGCHVCPFV